MNNTIKDKAFITNQIKTKKSLLCVGLDPDIKKMDKRFLSSQRPIQEFCKEIINITADFAIAFKLNVAFFESSGPRGWEQLKEVVESIPDECLIILDAKRADIGNTSEQYAQYYFDELNVDAVTLNPYMGMDSLLPFLNYKSKWSILLALTSNEGSSDIEKLELASGKLVYEQVIELFANSVYTDNIMFVCGATHPNDFLSIRKIIPDHFLLVPGIGAQGGDLSSVIKYGKNESGGLIINVSRAISYPTGQGSFEAQVRKVAESYQNEMALFID